MHQGLHQLLWIGAGRVDAMFDESRIRCEGPAALVMPPGVAHAFRFSPNCDGFVLTLDASRLVEGETSAASDALRMLFAKPLAVSLEAVSPDVARVQTLFEALHAENHAPDNADGPVPMWLARAIVWRLARICGPEDDRQARLRHAKMARC